MPCYDGRDSCGCGDNHSSAPTVIQVPVRADEDKAVIIGLTRTCCDMRTILRRNDLEKELTVESREWIKIHDEFDKRRIAVEEAQGERDRVKQEALDKLTLEERRVLGL